VIESRSEVRFVTRSRLFRVLVTAAAVAAVGAPAALSFGFNDGNHPPDGTVGVPYSYAFSVDGGCKPYVFVTLSGDQLPPGLAFDSNSTLSGTPTASGSFQFWLEVRDTGCSGGTCPPAGVSCTVPSQRRFTIYIAPKLVISTQSLGPALVGTPYTAKLAADGGGDQTWSLVGGSLPAGLTLAANGTISGTPSAATPDPVSFTVKVSDPSRNDTKTLTLDVVTPLAVTQATLPMSEVGRAVRSTTLAATGGRAPYTWAVASAPAGITIDPASGTVRGTPAAAGSFPLQVSVTDKYGTSASLALTLAVRAKVAVKTVRLPAARVGKPFHVAVRAGGGVGPYSWKATGKLPVGVRLDRRTGVLSGTARRAGTYRVTLTVTDSLGATSRLTLTLAVARTKT
jgi:hypothetical protein